MCYSVLEITYNTREADVFCTYGIGKNSNFVKCEHCLLYSGLTVVCEIIVSLHISAGFFFNIRVRQLCYICHS